MKGLTARPATAADLEDIALLSGRPVQLPTAEHEQLLVAVAEPTEPRAPGEPAQPEAADESGAPALRATLRLRPAIGLELPRLWYHVGCTVHAARELGLFQRQRSLLLGHDLTGASELADIAWLRDEQGLAAQAQALHLLVHTAWLLLGQQRRAYAQSLIAELPGLRDSAGQSPFWQGLGRHFYAGDPAAAAAQHGPAWRSHVAALLPRQALLASFLPAAAQAAIGQVHPQALLLREVLETAGLRYSHHVNLEDAGPVLQAETDDLPGVGGLRAYTVAAGAPPKGTPNWLLQSASGASWRAMCAPALVQASALQVSPETLKRLQARPGDRVTALLLPGAT